MHKTGKARTDGSIVQKPNDRVGWDGTKLEKRPSKPDTETIQEGRRDVARETLGAIRLAQAVIDPHSKRLLLRPDQQEIFDCWFGESPPTILTLVAGRRYGKTTLSCAIAAAQAFTHPGSLIWWVTPSYGPGVRPKQVIQAILESWGALKKASKLLLKCNNGSEVAFHSWWEAENLLGEGPDVIIMDEARLLGKADFEVVFFPMIIASEGRFLLASSQSGPRGFFYDMQIAGMEGDKQRAGYKTYFRMSEDNPLTDAGRLEMFKKEYGRAFERECHCVPMDMEEEGFLFSKENMQEMMIEPQQKSPTVSEPRVLGVDSAGAVGTSGWLMFQDGYVLNSGAEQWGDILNTVDKTMDIIMEYSPDAIGIDGTGAGGNDFFTLLRVALREKDLQIPLYAYPFNVKPDDIDLYSNWRIEKLFEIKHLISTGELSFVEEDNIDLARQMQSVRVEQNYKGMFSCVSKRSHKNVHCEDTVDALILALEAEKRISKVFKRRLTASHSTRRNSRHRDNSRFMIY